MATNLEHFIRARGTASDACWLAACFFALLNFLVLANFAAKHRLLRDVDRRCRAAQERYRRAVSRLPGIQTRGQRGALYDMAVGLGDSESVGPLACGICYAADKQLLALSCGHVLCSACATHASMKSRKQCVFCKKPIHFVMRLYNI
jgi:hypothetical protein